MGLAWLLFLPVVLSYNFLIYNPSYGHSHTNFLSKIADTLTDAGHNVTILMPIVNRFLVNHTGVKTTQDVIKIPSSPEMDRLFDILIGAMGVVTWEQPADKNMMISISQPMTDTFEHLCKETLARDDLLEELRSKKFDVGIAEPNMICGLGLIKGLGIPGSIAAVSTPPLETVSRMMGQPILPSFVPSATSSSSDRMTIWQRLKNLRDILNWDAIYELNYRAEHPLLVEKFGKEIGSIEDIVAGVSFQFLNSNPYLDFPFPTLQKNIPICGMQVNTEDKEKVDEKFDAILSERPKTVLISFGSLARSSEMPESYKTALLEVFTSMSDTTFIWKYEDDGATFTSHLKNVHLASWMPQKALLGDPRLSLFITHGGLGSTAEVAYLGKPAIMIPLFADQSRNSHMLCRHGGAVQLDKFALADAKKLKAAIEEMLNDNKYLANSQRLSDMLTSTPFTPKELVVRHAEFAAKFGALPNLDPYGRHLSFIEYFMLDIVIIFVVLVVLVLYVVKRLFTIICIRKQKTE